MRELEIHAGKEFLVPEFPFKAIIEIETVPACAVSVSVPHGHVKHRGPSRFVLTDLAQSSVLSVETATEAQVYLTLICTDEHRQRILLAVPPQYSSGDTSLELVQLNTHDRSFGINALSPQQAAPEVVAPQSELAEIVTGVLAEVEPLGGQTCYLLIDISASTSRAIDDSSLELLLQLITSFFASMRVSAHVVTSACMDAPLEENWIPQILNQRAQGHIGWEGDPGDLEPTTPIVLLSDDIPYVLGSSPNTVHLLPFSTWTERILPAIEKKDNAEVERWLMPIYQGLRG